MYRECTKIKYSDSCNDIDTILASQDSFLNQRDGLPTDATNFSVADNAVLASVGLVRSVATRFRECNLSGL